MKKALNISELDWEALCKRCGSCCFEKRFDAYGKLKVSPVSCRYLDISTRECRVYAQRFHTGEECLKLTPQNVAYASWLPYECAYREYVASNPSIQLEE
jgi:uncharacterized cysteine cluster protein YcgN (CxxCxxCC family)